MSPLHAEWPEDVLTRRPLDGYTGARGAHP